MAGPFVPGMNPALPSAGRGPVQTQQLAPQVPEELLRTVITTLAQAASKKPVSRRTETDRHVLKRARDLGISTVPKESFAEKYFNAAKKLGANVGGNAFDLAQQGASAVGDYLGGDTGLARDVREVVRNAKKIPGFVGNPVTESNRLAESLAPYARGVRDYATAPLPAPPTGIVGAAQSAARQPPPTPGAPAPVVPSGAQAAPVAPGAVPPVGRPGIPLRAPPAPPQPAPQPAPQLAAAQPAPPAPPALPGPPPGGAAGADTGAPPGAGANIFDKLFNMSPDASSDLLRFSSALAAAGGRPGATLGGSIGQAGLALGDQRTSRRAGKAAGALKSREFDVEERRFKDAAAARLAENKARREDKGLDRDVRAEATRQNRVIQKLLADISKGKADAKEKLDVELAQQRTDNDAADYRASLVKTYTGGLGSPNPEDAKEIDENVSTMFPQSNFAKRFARKGLLDQAASDIAKVNATEGLTPEQRKEAIGRVNQLLQELLKAK